jgi:lysophospholipase L1-like esterase
MKKNWLLFSVLLLFSFALPNGKKHIRVYLIGDSTMCTYNPAQAPITGWGMPFATFFDSSVTIENRARGGRSTRTFLSENRWKPIADSLQDGDYVFIQFGHNDEAKERQYADRYTPVEDYKKNLRVFINETRARRATPVLVTPVTRMRFDKGGKIMETHVEYTGAMYEVAKDMHVALIDLDAKSRALLQQYGPENAKILFMQLAPDEHPNYPNGQKDNTHFNEYGARKVAELVLAGIRENHLDLEQRIVSIKKAAK